MRFLIAAVLVLSLGCSPKELPEDTDEIKSLTAKQAAELVATLDGDWLSLAGLTSIDKDVAHQLSKFEAPLSLDGLTSIDKDVLQELAKLEGELSLDSLTSIDKDVAQELAKFKAEKLSLNGLTSIDKDVAQELGKFKGKTLSLSAKALQTYEEVNGESPSVRSGGMF